LGKVQLKRNNLQKKAMSLNSWLLYCVWYPYALPPKPAIFTAETLLKPYTLPAKLHRVGAA
jgi:hypothetical protein